MHRRHFVTTTLASAAAISGTDLLKAEESPLAIKKGVKFSMVAEPNLSLTETFKLLKEVGFDGTELRTTDDERLGEFAKAVEASEFPVHGVVNSSDPDLPRAVRFAKAIGGDTVLYVARYDRKRPLMESWRETQEVIRKGLPSAEKHGIKLLVENVWAGFLISALDMERFVDEIDSPWFGAYFDVGNNVRWGVPQHWIEVLGDRIGKLDIKEWDDRLHQQEGLRAGFGSELGDGTIDWAEVRSALRKIGYSGWATAEVKGGDRERLADISARMDSVLGLV
ncbi:MAG: sugar phosphate isomerase/epimerase family protein [Verrucomicrobiota bacterium]